jgi:hypothetical protein
LQKKENEGILLLKWIVIANPKDLGGWGIKNIHHFGKALVAKGLWWIISNKGLCIQVIKHKYIEPSTIEEWVKKSLKKNPQCFNSIEVHCHSLSIGWELDSMEGGEW